MLLVSLYGDVIVYSVCAIFITSAAIIVASISANVNVMRRAYPVLVNESRDRSTIVDNNVGSLSSFAQLSNREIVNLRHSVCLPCDAQS